MSAVFLGGISRAMEPLFGPLRSFLIGGMAQKLSDQLRAAEDRIAELRQN